MRCGETHRAPASAAELVNNAWVDGERGEEYARETVNSFSDSFRSMCSVILIEAMDLEDVVSSLSAADGGDGNVKFANNKAEWDAVTGGNDGLIAVQISTKTCGPCKVIYPTFVGLSEEFAEKATFVKIMGDTDTESRALMKEWGVRVVPLFMLWKNGEKIAEWSGAKPDVLRENVTSAM